MCPGRGQAWGDTHTEQGFRRTVVMIWGLAHGLVVIHGHTEMQKQTVPKTTTPCPGLRALLTELMLTGIPEGTQVITVNREPAPTKGARTCLDGFKPVSSVLAVVACGFP